MAHRTWPDGQDRVVTSLEALKHIADTEGTLREMHRVLRPGGRAVFTLGEYVKAGWGATDESGARNAWGVVGTYPFDELGQMHRAEPTSRRTRSSDLATDH